MKLLADEDFNNRIVRGLIRHYPDLKIVRIQDVALMGVHDIEILEWADQNSFVLLTHDVNTMTAYAFERLKSGHSLGGVIIVPQKIAIGDALEDIYTVVTCLEPGEMKNRILFLPL